MKTQFWSMICEYLFTKQMSWRTVLFNWCFQIADLPYCFRDLPILSLGIFSCMICIHYLWQPYKLNIVCIPLKFKTALLKRALKTKYQIHSPYILYMCNYTWILPKYPIYNETNIDCCRVQWSKPFDPWVGIDLVICLQPWTIDQQDISFPNVINTLDHYTWQVNICTIFH